MLLRRIRTYRILALVLSMVMLVTSVGVSMDMHFCQEELKSVRLVGKAPNCHERSAAASCHNNAEVVKACHQAPEIPECERDCCHHEVRHALLETDCVMQNAQHQVLGQWPCVTTFVFAHIIEQHPPRVFNNPFLTYKPPQNTRDIPVLVQSFLI